MQGVWFRESTRQVAERLGIHGFAKNLPDGSVEVLACGSPESLEQLVEFLREGPRMASVDDVMEFGTDCCHPQSFTTG